MGAIKCGTSPQVRALKVQSYIITLHNGEGTFASDKNKFKTTR